MDAGQGHIREAMASDIVVEHSHQSTPQVKETEMAQWMKALATKPEDMSPWNGWGRELIPQSCPLRLHEPWHPPCKQISKYEI